VVGYATIDDESPMVGIWHIYCAKSVPSSVNPLHQPSIIILHTANGIAHRPVGEGGGFYVLHGTAQRLPVGQVGIEPRRLDR